MYGYRPGNMYYVLSIRLFLIFPTLTIAVTCYHLDPDNTKHQNNQHQTATSLPLTAPSISCAKIKITFHKCVNEMWKTSRCKFLLNFVAEFQQNAILKSKRM